MQLEEYFNVLALDDIRLKGTRIGIESILYEYIYRARTAEEIAQIYPLLTLEQVYATILYYLHHREAVGQYLTDWIEFGERMRTKQRQNPSPARLRFQHGFVNAGSIDAIAQTCIQLKKVYRRR